MHPKVGPKAVGQTTILYKLRSNEILTIIPITDFNVKTAKATPVWWSGIYGARSEFHPLLSSHRVPLTKACSLWTATTDTRYSGTHENAGWGWVTVLQVFWQQEGGPRCHEHSKITDKLRLHTLHHKQVHSSQLHQLVEMNCLNEGLDCGWHSD